MSFLVMIVPTNSPFKSLKELIEDIRGTPRASRGLRRSCYPGYLGPKLLKAINVDVDEASPSWRRPEQTQVTLTAGGNVKLGIGSTGTTIPAIQGGIVARVGGDLEETASGHT